MASACRTLGIVGVGTVGVRTVGVGAGIDGAGTAGGDGSPFNPLGVRRPTREAHVAGYAAQVV